MPPNDDFDLTEDTGYGPGTADYVDPADQPTADLVTTRPVFYGGELVPPGTLLKDVPLKVRRVNGEIRLVGRGYGRNFIDPAKALPITDMPMKPLGPHADAPEHPQGVPPGAVEINGVFYVPATFDNAGNPVSGAQRVIAASVGSDPATRDRHEGQVAAAEANVAAEADLAERLQVQADANARPGTRQLTAAEQEDADRAKALADAGAADDPYAGLDKDAVIAEVERRGLPPVKTKAAGIEALEADDKKAAAAEG